MNTPNGSDILLSEHQNIELTDDPELLDIMLADVRGQSPLYQPGPYWATSVKNAANEIKRCGIADFRGSTNFIGMSYADNLSIDIRNAYNHGLRRLVFGLTRMYPLNRVYEAQVRYTEAFANESIAYAQELLNIKERTRNLLKKYVVPFSLLGNCLRKVKIDGRHYSIQYLDLLEQHDNIASRVNFDEAFSVFEIGGGFGTNIHLLLSNYKNIRKVLYLDIPPNLYVGTQYLKAFYGAAVRDYRALRSLGSIKFSDDDSLEIYCIAPWQIEHFGNAIDIFINSHSFNQMPANTVKNYADQFNKFPSAETAAIALITYDNFDPSTTLLPSELPKFFANRAFDYFEVSTLLNSTRKNLFFVSHGNLPALSGKDKPVVSA